MLTEMAWDFITDKTVIFITVFAFLLFGFIFGITQLVNFLSSKIRKN